MTAANGPGAIAIRHADPLAAHKGHNLRRGSLKQLCETRPGLTYRNVRPSASGRAAGTATSGCETLGLHGRDLRRVVGVTSAQLSPDEVDRMARARSIGQVASPLLAGFSFTNVIVLAMTADTAQEFLWPGLAMITWVAATLTFIVSIQAAKYVPNKVFTADDVARYERWTDLFYHLGVAAFLLGFAFALAPTSESGSHMFRWLAATVVGITCLTELGVFVKMASCQRHPKIDPLPASEN